MFIVLWYGKADSREQNKADFYEIDQRVKNIMNQQIFRSLMNRTLRGRFKGERAIFRFFFLLTGPKV